MKKIIFLALGLAVLAGAVWSLIGNNESGTVGSYDRLSRTPVNLDYEHAKIHSGDHFYLCGHTTLASGASTTFAVTAADDETKAHMTFFISGSNITEVELYEGISTTTVGTFATPRNSNRESVKTSNLWVSVDAFASSSYATLLSEYKYGDSSKFSGAGGTVERNHELVLDPEKTYYWKVISGAADNIITYCGHWYETLN